MSEIREAAAAEYKNEKYRGAWVVKAHGGLNMRTNAGTKNTIILTVPNGSTVQCYGYYNKSSDTPWLYVVYKGRVGYCSSKYLSKK